ncbi:MAG: hypothetical protein IJ094_13010 [Bacilli bacterium]|nr:hypothetical protein [Bacilli bacterium]
MKNKRFSEFLTKIDKELMAYELDASCFDDYDEEDVLIMNKLRQVIHPSSTKQELYLFKNNKEFVKANESTISICGGNFSKKGVNQ